MRTIASLAVMMSVSGLALAIGCSSSESSNNPLPPGNDAGVDAEPPAEPLAEPAVGCGDAMDAIYGDPGSVPAMDQSQRGAIVKCNKAADVSAETMQARSGAFGYVGKPFTSGARVYRVLYRTTRGDAAGTPGFSSAIVFIPTVQRANRLPLIVAARGTQGQAAACAISKKDPSAEGNDFARLAFPLVGNGYAVIIPDLAGYANYGAPGNPPSGYAQFADVGKSILDGSHALKKLYPQLRSQTVLVGHSQGGHSALSALSLADSYGAEGAIAGVAVYAPLWLSQRSWGAILDVGVAESLHYSIAEAPLPNAVSVWYHYTEAELLDGPGEGKKLFRDDKADKVKEFIDNVCLKSKYEELEALGQYSYALFKEEFTQQVAHNAAFGGTCEPGSLCEKWLKRYSQDRPHLTGTAAKVPILSLYGGKDTTIPPDRMQCGFKRLEQDEANLTICFEPEANHSTIIDKRGEYVASWIDSIANGAPAPAACPASFEDLNVACNPIPPND
jgi:pimeloyl-ACP methyl ester carboxylesterase